jgi:hypothetical protein
MRNYIDSHIDLATRRHLGGGSSAPSTSSSDSQNKMMMKQMRAQTKASEASNAALLEQSKQQQSQMNAQLALMEQQRQDSLKSQQDQLDVLKASQVKPDPAAQVVDSTTDDQEQRKIAAKRQGMRKSILAGESNQAPLLTGPSTLG